MREAPLPCRPTAGDGASNRLDLISRAVVSWGVWAGSAGALLGALVGLAAGEDPWWLGALIFGWIGLVLGLGLSATSAFRSRGLAHRFLAWAGVSATAFSTLCVAVIFFLSMPGELWWAFVTMATAMGFGGAVWETLMEAGRGRRGPSSRT